MIPQIQEDIRTTLLTNNPFSTYAAGEPWDEEHPSVDSLNKDVLERIKTLLREKIQNSRIPLAAVVFGDSGMGKTHLLKRILDAVRRENIPASLVFVRSIFSPQTAMQRLLSEIVRNLDRKIHDVGPTQFDFLIAKMLGEYLEYFFSQPENAKWKQRNEKFIHRLKNDLYAVLNCKINEKTRIKLFSETSVFLRNHLPNIPKTFLRVLFQYSEKNKRGVVMEWLHGRPLDREDSALLGLDDIPPQSWDDNQYIEDKSRDIIIALGLLLERYHRSLLICFDQLDALYEKEKVLTFQNMVHFLVNEATAMLPVAFLRNTTWDLRFHVMDEAVRERLLMHPLTLNGCSAEQAKELIEKRILYKFPDHGREYAQWLNGILYPRLYGGESPRQVISLASQIIWKKDEQTCLPQPSEQVLNQELNQELSRVRNDLPQPDAERLQKSLRFFLENRCIFHAENDIFRGSHGQLTGKISSSENLLSPIHCAFFFNTSSSGNSVSAAYRSALAFQEKNPDARCYYVTDSRCSFRDTWKKAAEYRDEFLQNGGRFISLDEETAARWFSLLFLTDKIRAGDVANPKTEEVMTEKQLSEYVKNHFPYALIDLPFDTETNVSPVSDAEAALSASQETPPSIPQEIPAVSEVLPHPFDNEANELLDNLLNTFQKLKLPVEPYFPESYQCGPRLIRLRIVPDQTQNVTVKKIENKSADLKVAMHLQEEPLIQAQTGFVSVDILRRRRETLTLGQLLRDAKKNPPDNSDAVFPLGAEIDGSPFWVNLADPNTPSILIGGTSGSGKSELLKSIVIGLGATAPPRSVYFTLIDPKRVTFTDFYDLPCLNDSVITDEECALEALNALVEKMELRYEKFESAGVPDIAAYNRVSEERFCRHIVIIDEYADMLSNKLMTEKLEFCFKKIGAKGRAAGFHLVLATQRPDAKVVTGLVKANLQLKIALKVTSNRNSQVILDESGAECLAGQGDMLIGGAVSRRRLQGALATTDDIENLKKHWKQFSAQIIRDNLFRLD
ncbi:MAG: hypothetical protein LBT05_03605 [Planctomycetaceae bacterium]|nr:hypothetical protein [Planctomycetaceae bacterium]